MQLAMMMTTVVGANEPLSCRCSSHVVRAGQSGDPTETRTRRQQPCVGKVAAAGIRAVNADYFVMQDWSDVVLKFMAECCTAATFAGSQSG